MSTAGRCAPQGWRWVEFEEVAENHDKSRVPLKRADRAARQGEYPYYGASGIIDTIDEYLFNGDYLLVAEDGANLLSRSTPIAFTARGQFWVNNHAHVVKTLGGMPLGYLAAYLNSIDVSQHVTGTAQPKLTQASLNRVLVPIAPLNEQARIVEVIEAHLTRLDAAVAALERVQANLKRYRASVLKAAVEGRLVPTEAELARRDGRDYEPASVLLERILAERRRRWEEAELVAMKAKGKAPKDDTWKAKYQEPGAPGAERPANPPDGWCWAILGQLLIDIEAGKNFKCVERPPEGNDVGVVKVSAVTWGTFDQVESKTCTNPELINKKLFIAPRDFLFSRANTIELVGACVIVDGITKRLMLSDKILRLRFLGGMDWWVLWVLRSKYGRQEIESLATGNQESMRNIAQARIEQIRIPLPPAAEQSRILERLSTDSTRIAHAEQTAEAGLLRCERLRQAVLKWAFEGKLVDQDPNDEPASVLLDRIRAERAASAGAPGETPSRSPRARGAREAGPRRSGARRAKA